MSTRAVEPGDRLGRNAHRIDNEFLAGTFKHLRPNRMRPMAATSPAGQTKIAFGRAFLVELERGDTTLATLFARAFVVQGAVVSGPAGPGVAQ